jgi:hypothetical protein
MMPDIFMQPGQKKLNHEILQPFFIHCADIGRCFLLLLRRKLKKTITGNSEAKEYQLF